MADTFRNLFSGSRSSATSGSSASSGDDATAPASTHQEVTPDIIPSATIKVVGLGGGGCNAVKRMVEMKAKGVECIAVNTDAQALYHNPAQHKINIGRSTTRGLGAGANPDMGKKSAEENMDELKKSLEGADMVFLTAGMGGGTGTGSIIPTAELARSMGILTVAVVTKPFSFEGLKRKKQAEEALEQLRGKVDTLIVIPNDKILSLIDKSTPLTEAFNVVDEVLHQGIDGIASLITVHGLVNVDFADVKSIVQDAGTALMGIGYGNGDSRAAEAARAAIDSPLLDLSISGAKGVLFNITGGSDLSMFEIDEAARIITEAADPEAMIIFGTVIDDELSGAVKCTVIATGFDDAHLETIGSGAPSVFRPTTVGSATPQPSRPTAATPATPSMPDTLSSAESVQENALGVSEEELEVPAFMRKKLSK